MMCDVTAFLHAVCPVTTLTIVGRFLSVQNNEENVFLCAGISPLPLLDWS